MTKNIELKTLNPQQLNIVKGINNQIIEYQTVFEQQPEELLITKPEFIILSGEDNLSKYKYLKLNNIKIFYI